MQKVYLLLFYVLITHVLFSQTQSFKVGESIIYDVIADVPDFSINGKVATLESTVVSITNIYGSDCYHIKAVVYGDSWANSVYTLKNTYETWVDTNTFETKKIVKFIKEDSYTNIQISIFTNGIGYNFIDYQRESGVKFVEVSQLAFDFLSLVYYMRFIDKEQKEFSINLVDGDSVSNNLSFSIEEGVSVKSVLALRKIKTYRIKENTQYRIEAYISKKYNQVPIDVSIANVNIFGHTIKVRGILRQYKEK